MPPPTPIPPCPRARRTATALWPRTALDPWRARPPSHSKSWRPEAGFTETQLDPNDDRYSEQQVDMGFSIVFGGHDYSKLWVNNNGNVTFDNDNGLGTFTPFEMSSSTTRIIAAFFADVNTRTGYSLQWLPSLDGVNKIPASGTRTVIAADVQGVLCIRIFDANSQMVVDTARSPWRIRSMRSTTVWRKTRVRVST